MTIKTFLEAASVSTGDDKWMRGYEADFEVAGRTYSASGQMCDPTTTPSPSGARAVYAIKPFVIETKQEFSTFCDPGTAEKSTDADVSDASEYFVARNFWNGDADDWEGADEGVFLLDADVTTVAPGASVAASIGAALARAYEKTPSIKPVLHLGVTAALSLGPNFFTDESDLAVAVSPGYPVSGVAVTGPVKANLSDVQTVGLTDQEQNDVLVYGSRFASVEFDPRLAVRVSA
jgi:hypothetical protein